jgi:hypothetical protein
MGILRKPTHERLEQIHGRLLNPCVRVRTPCVLVGRSAQAPPSGTCGEAMAREESAAVGGCQSQLPLYTWHYHLAAEAGALDDIQTPEGLWHGGHQVSQALVDVEDAAVPHAQHLEILGQPSGPTATRQIEIEIKFIQATYGGQLRLQDRQYSVESHQQRAVSLEREPFAAHVDLCIEPAMGRSGRVPELGK